MPLYKGLMPGKEEIRFVSGANIGFNPINMTPMEVADNIELTDEPKNEETSIPSMIAHFISYVDKIRDGIDTDTINEWRGMLATIALRKHYPVNIKVESIDVFASEATNLQKAFGEELTDNAARTGYEIDPVNGKCKYDKFYYFTKDDKAFAAFLPSIGLCPFSEYPEDLFDEVELYDCESKKWKDISDLFDADSKILAKKLACWIEELGNECKDETGIFNKFKKAVYADAVTHAANDFTAELLGEGFNDASKTFGKTCSLPENAPKNMLSEKMLVIITSFLGKDDTFDMTQIEGGFTPVKLGVKEDKKDKEDKEDEGDYYYVIPPVHEDVAKCIRDGHAVLDNYEISEHKNSNNQYDGIFVSFTLKFGDTVNGYEIMQTQHLFKFSEIYLTKNMPYMVSWPSVGCRELSKDWKENYIALYANTNANGAGAVLREPEIFYNNGSLVSDELKYVDTFIPTDPNAVEIGVLALNDNAKIEKYKCESYFIHENFEMLKSVSRPYALKFNISGKSLGIWNIKPKRYYDDMQLEKYLCIDFGTTSTNVRLADSNRNSKLLDSPYAYINTIYKNLGDEDTIVCQNYLLFSNYEGTVGKTFTYAQNFDSKVYVGEKLNPVDAPISNITGKVMVLDNKVILDGVNPDSGIYGGLKYSTGAAHNPNEVNAASNFLDNFLTLGVLQAKLEGAATVELRVSYPNGKSKANIDAALQPIITDLIEKSSLEISVVYITEAKAAGAYYTNFAPTDPAIVPPTAVSGYSIVDIGGGTTDISYQKADFATPNNVETRMESSIEFAGKNLMRETLCSIANPIDIFENTENDNNLKEDAREAYNTVEDVNPIIAERKKRYGMILDYLLEETEISNSKIKSVSNRLLASTIVFKYYSLFYLISKMIKDNINKGIIDDAPFTICLAGCGSRGFELCKRICTGNIFMDNTKKIIAKAFTNIDEGAITIIPPYNNDKREVVEGLPFADTNPVAGDDHAPAAGGAPDNAEIAQRVLESYEGLTQVLKSVDDFRFEVCNSSKHIDPNDDLFRIRYNAAYTQAVAVWAQAEIYEPIKYDYLALLILNEILK